MTVEGIVLERIKTRAKRDIARVGECLIWQGATNGGYPVVAFEKKLIYVHRVIAALDGRDPAGRVVMHECDNPKCVNPKHLILGTQLENLEDMRAKGRQAKGESNNSKLTEAQVLEMRREYDAGGVGSVLLSRKYGINPVTCWEIVKRKKWRHLP